MFHGFSKPTPVDRADVVAVRYGMRRLFELPQDIRQAGDRRRTG